MLQLPLRVGLFAFMEDTCRQPHHGQRARNVE